MPKAKKAPRVFWGVINGQGVITYASKDEEAALAQVRYLRQTMTVLYPHNLIRLTETAPPVKRRGRKKVIPIGRFRK